MTAKALARNSSFIPATGVSLLRPIPTQKAPGRRSMSTFGRPTPIRVRRYCADSGVLTAIELAERFFEICTSLRLQASRLRRPLSSICRERNELGWVGWHTCATLAWVVRLRRYYSLRPSLAYAGGCLSKARPVG